MYKNINEKITGNVIIYRSVSLRAPIIIGEISEVFINCITVQNSASTVSQVDDNNLNLGGVLIHIH